MKYLIGKLKNYDLERAFLFDKEIQHKDFGKVLEILGYKAVRGGFIYSGGENGDKLKCHGEAFSLGLISDPEKDLALILEALET